MPAPLVTVKDIRLEAFESLVYARKHEEAWRELMEILRRMSLGGGFEGHVLNENTQPRLYSRLAAAITALIADPQFQLSGEGLDFLAIENRTLSAIFRVSIFENSDHLMRQFGEPDVGDSGKLYFNGPKSFVKLLATYSLESDIDIDFEQISRQAPRLALPFWLGMLSRYGYLSVAAHNRREKLLELGPIFEQVEFGESLLAAMSTAWMHSSYAESERKHEIKRSLNLMMRRLVEKQATIPSMPAHRKVAKRPTLLVPIEYFSSWHAMYRCYAPSIRQLREKFRLVIICRPTDVDETARLLFDEVIELAELSGTRAALPSMVARIQAVRPDLIYYPSLGMSPWWVALCTVRLAPIQFMTMGHPATTFSDAIDYVLISEKVPGDASNLSETAFLIEGDIAMTRVDYGQFPSQSIRQAPDVIRVAVPAFATKLNAPFLAACRNIARRSRRKLEFHFFPNMVGLMWHQVTLDIRKWIPAAIVHRRSDYNEYLGNLAKCDVHLSTFPFGGTNSNIDSMRLCIPMVTMAGPEVHSQTDAGMMRAAGLPEWLITYHPSEYERAALKLIDKDAERIAVAKMLQGVDVEVVFRDRPDNQYSADFANAVWLIYSKHEAIQKSGRRYWTVQQRREFAA